MTNLFLNPDATGKANFQSLPFLFSISNPLSLVSDGETVKKTDPPSGEPDFTFTD